MASVLYSPLIADISGSIGQATFQRNRQGNTLRRKPYKPNPNSPGQQLIKQYMTELIKYWQTTTPAIRANYANFVAYNSPSIKANAKILLSGYQLFIKYNMYRLVTGWSILSTITYTQLSQYPRVDDFVRSTEPDMLECEFSEDLNISNNWAVLKVTAPLRASQKANRPGLRTIVLDHVTQGSFEIQDEYVALFGALPDVGDYIMYEIINFSMLAPIFHSPFSSIAQVIA